MKILVINGANLNMLGIRERGIYGDLTYKQMKKLIGKNYKELGFKPTFKISNSEGKIVEYIQKAYKKYQAIVINAGAYTHTSIAILDALKSVDIFTVEVHLSDIKKREKFRQFSYISCYAQKCFMGEGIDGYYHAGEYIKNNLERYEK